MTKTRRCRRITLHFSHIGLTLGRTFMFSSLSRTARSCTRPSGCALCLPTGRPVAGRPPIRSLVAVGDPTPGQVVGGDLHLHLVPGEDPDTVHPHLSRAVSQHLVPVLELHSEHGIRQRLYDRPFQHDGIFFGLGQVNLLDSLSLSSPRPRGRGASRTTVTSSVRTAFGGTAEERHRERDRHATTQPWPAERPV